MTGRRIRRLAEWLRWVFLAGAVAIVVVFLVAQRQSTDIAYGQAPDTPTIPEGSAGELTGATLPSVEQMTAMLAAHDIVRLPGATAWWDARRVEQAIGDADIRILVAPPGLTEAQRDQISDVDDATIRIIGTQVSGDIYQVVPDTLDEWRAQFARADVTGLLVTLINSLEHDSAPSGQPDGADGAGGGSGDGAPGDAWREPTADELDTVTAALRDTGWYAAPGATLSAMPATASKQAFGTGTALYVALPVQPADTPAPAYGPALATRFPGRPIVVMYGSWIEYFGPHAADFADVAGASFYGRFGDRLSKYAYPQDNVLGAYLGQVTDIRYSGLFDRPLPYRPVDPLRVALPALPWLFAACVAGFLALSVRSLLRPATATAGRLAAIGGSGVPARLAGLTSLAVEVCGLTDAHTDPALTRAIGKLGAAREALDEGLPDRHVRALLDDAQADLDSVGRRIGVAGYRPETYLRGRLA